MRVGLVGTGWWAQGTPGPALVASEYVELVGVWGRDPGRTAAAAEALGCAGYDDVDALIAAVDAVAFAVPADVQAPIALRAARAGRHLLLEKPLAFTVGDADAIEGAVADAGVAALVFTTDSYRPEIVEDRRVVDAGTWSGARVTIFVPALRPGGVLLDSPWRVERGALWDTGPHAVTPLLEVLGPVTEVVALEGPQRTLQAVLRHGEHASSTVTTSLEAPESITTWDVAWYGPDGWHAQPPSRSPSPEAYRHAITDLVRAAGAGTTTRSTVTGGRDTVAVLAALERSLVERALVAPAPRGAAHARRHRR